MSKKALDGRICLFSPSYSSSCLSLALLSGQDAAVIIPLAQAVGVLEVTIQEVEEAPAEAFREVEEASVEAEQAEDGELV